MLINHKVQFHHHDVIEFDLKYNDITIVSQKSKNDTMFRTPKIKSSPKFYIIVQA